MNRFIGIYDKFARALSNAVQEMQVGDGFHEGVSQVISHAPYVALVFFFVENRRYYFHFRNTCFKFVGINYQVMMGSIVGRTLRVQRGRPNISV